MVRRRPQHPGRIHEIAVGLQVEREPPVRPVRQRSSDRRGEVVAEPEAAGMTDVMVMLLHRPHARGPARHLAVGADHRPVEFLDHRPNLGGEPRGADRGSVPSDRHRCQVAFARFLLGLARSFAAPLDRGLAIGGDGRSDRFDQRRKRGFGIGRHMHVNDLEALEVLVVRLGQQVDRADADELGPGLDARLVDAVAVLAIIDPGVHGGPIVGQLHTENDVGLADHARGTAEMMRPSENSCGRPDPPPGPAAARQAGPGA